MASFDLNRTLELVRQKVAAYAEGMNKIGFDTNSDYDETENILSYVKEQCEEYGFTDDDLKEIFEGQCPEHTYRELLQNIAVILRLKGKKQGVSR